MPDYFQGLAQWWLWLISSLAGVVAFKDDFNKDDTWKIHGIKFTWRIAVSTFAGVIGFLAAIALGFSPPWVPVMVATTAWRGPKGLEALASLMDGMMARKSVDQSTGK